MASNSSIRSKAQSLLTEGLIAVPSSLTILPGGTAGKDTVIFQMTIANTTGGTLTYTLQDNAGNQILAAVSIPGNTTELIVWPEGIRFVGGAKHQASNSGIVGEIFGFVHA
jgi:hypothetical protein